jgi:pyruvate dehydrogenase E1 component alpha subunit
MEPSMSDTGAEKQPRSGPGAVSERFDLRRLYETMVLIRLFEPEAERQYKKANIGGYCHLSTGQEAATVGAVAPLAEEDYLLMSYRTHGLVLARGTPPETVMAELFGREGGAARGRGGSMHLLDVGRNMLGGWGIVGGQLPIATGVALALVQQGRRQAVLCELGDGAVNMGAWHESLNLAGLWDLPIVYLVMNNQYGMGTAVDRASAEPELHKRSCAYRIHGERVDGDDLEAMLEASERLLDRARDERRPAVLEAMTYRYRGHSVADAGLNYRTRDEIQERQDTSDPIRILADRLKDRGELTDDDDVRIAEQQRRRVDDAVAFATESPLPDESTLAHHVYADAKFKAQSSRMRPGSPFGENELVFDRGLTT